MQQFLHNETSCRIGFVFQVKARGEAFWNLILERIFTATKIFSIPQIPQNKNKAANE